MRKSLLLVAVALLAPMAVRAQTIAVSANIPASASFTGAQDLNFGNVTAAGATVDPTNMAANGNRTLHYNYGLTVGFSAISANLVSGGNNLAVSLTCNVQSGATWGTSGPCSSTTFPLAAPTATTTAVVGVGGSISAAAASAAPAGLYTGAITITVTP